MDAMKVHLYLKLLVSCEKSTPVGLQILILHIFLLALTCMDVENVPYLIYLVLLLTLVVVVGE